MKNANDKNVDGGRGVQPALPLKSHSPDDASASQGGSLESTPPGVEKESPSSETTPPEHRVKGLNTATFETKRAHADNDTRASRAPKPAPTEAKRGPNRQYTTKVESTLNTSKIELDANVKPIPKLDRPRYPDTVHRDMMADAGLDASSLLKRSYDENEVGSSKHTASVDGSPVKRPRGIDEGVVKEGQAKMPSESEVNSSKHAASASDSKAKKPRLSNEGADEGSKTTMAAKADSTHTKTIGGGTAAQATQEAKNDLVQIFTTWLKEKVPEWSDRIREEKALVFVDKKFKSVDSIELALESAGDKAEEILCKDIGMETWEARWLLDSIKTGATTEAS